MFIMESTHVSLDNKADVPIYSINSNKIIYSHERSKLMHFQLGINNYFKLCT